MGFAELGDSLARGNRALRDNTLGKYFKARERRRVAEFAEHQLPEPLLKKARVQQRRAMHVTYALFIVVAIIVIVGLLIIG